MEQSIDLNADLGEGFGHDAVLMPLISSANIACGGHAGNVDSMRTAVRCAVQHGVIVGAHPSYPDRAHFGRVSVDMDPSQLVFSLTAQLWALKAVCIEEGAVVRYIKPHGALYNDAARDPQIAQLLASMVREVDPDLAIMGLAGSALIDAAREAGLATISEAFADRAYQPDGSLVPRSESGAVITDPAKVIAQVLEFVGKVDSICLHGDNPDAIHLAREINGALADKGILVRAKK